MNQDRFYSNLSSSSPVSEKNYNVVLSQQCYSSSQHNAMAAEQGVADKALENETNAFINAPLCADVTKCAAFETAVESASTLVVSRELRKEAGYSLAACVSPRETLKTAAGQKVKGDKTANIPEMSKETAASPQVGDSLTLSSLTISRSQKGADMDVTYARSPPGDLPEENFADLSAWKHRESVSSVSSSSTMLTAATSKKGSTGSFYCSHGMSRVETSLASSSKVSASLPVHDGVDGRDSDRCSEDTLNSPFFVPPSLPTGKAQLSPVLQAAARIFQSSECEELDAALAQSGKEQLKPRDHCKNSRKTLPAMQQGRLFTAQLDSNARNMVQNKSQVTSHTACLSPSTQSFASLTSFQAQESVHLPNSADSLDKLKRFREIDLQKESDSTPVNSANLSTVSSACQVADEECLKEGQRSTLKKEQASTKHIYGQSQVGLLNDSSPDLSPRDTSARTESSYPKTPRIDFVKVSPSQFPELSEEELLLPPLTKDLESCKVFSVAGLTKSGVNEGKKVGLAQTYVTGMDHDDLYEGFSHPLQQVFSALEVTNKDAVYITHLKKHIF